MEHRGPARHPRDPLLEPGLEAVDNAGTMQPHPVVRFLVVALALALTPAFAAAAGLTVVAPPAAIHGQEGTFAGTLTEVAECLQGREVHLERRTPGEAAWTTEATATTASDGSFAVSIIAQGSAELRASVASEPRGVVLCEAAASPVVSWQVHAAVAMTVPGLRASRCLPASISVQPGKPGTTVEVQRSTPAGWTAIGAAVLSAASTAKVPVCAAWDDLGSVRLRARWPQQDDLHAEGTGAVVNRSVAKAGWMRKIDRLTKGLPIGVAVHEAGTVRYARAERVRRVPASNEKLLLSMAVLDAFGADASLPTIAAGRRRGGVVKGDLWILGRGDPATGKGDLRRLARAIRDAGVRRIKGGVRGSTGYFARDWWAPGWRRYFPGTYVKLPTALTFERNGRARPELRAAETLMRFLRKAGVTVRGRPDIGSRAGGLPEIARVERPLLGVLGSMNRDSSNFTAEVLAKGLGADRAGTPGTIAKGAAAIRAWAKAQGVGVRTRDGSGLSYANRATPRGMARLLEVAESEPWGKALRDSLPTGGEGTLEHRLRGLPVRAKTGTLTSISALSGWVLAKRTGTWIEFSIMATGMSPSRAKGIEDRIVKLLWRAAA